MLLVLFNNLKRKAMNTHAKDPGNGGCCGGITDMGCC